jgi:hypothetical protein
MTAVPSLTTTGLNKVDHRAVTWKAPAVLGAWYFTVSEEEASAPSIVPSGHGPAGCVLPDQLHCAPLAPFTASSVMVQIANGAGAPLTVACTLQLFSGCERDRGSIPRQQLVGTPEPKSVVAKVEPAPHRCPSVGSHRVAEVTGHHKVILSWTASR